MTRTLSFHSSMLLRAGFLLSFLSACSPVAEPTPTPYPDTPSPPQINAPLVESPALATIRFVNELDGWGVTETQIVRTNDGGIMWYDVTPPDLTETGYSVDEFILDNDHVWIQKPDFENFPNGGVLYRTNDGGVTWTNTNAPFSRADIAFLDPNNGWALADLGVGAGSNAVAVYQTMDGGANWTQKYINDPNASNASDSLPLSGLKHGLAASNMQTAWVYGVVYTSGVPYLYRTDDGGANWTQVTSLPLPPGAENFELGVEQIKFTAENIAFLALRVAADETKLAVYITNDKGKTWTLTPTLIPNGGSADFLSGAEAVIYNGEQFYVTRDAARTWSIIPPDVVFGETFAMMDFVNTSTGWVITLDSTTNHRALYRTTDGGLTWSPLVP